MRIHSILVTAGFLVGPVLSQASCLTGALSFDGVNDRVTVPYDSSFPVETFTAGAWIKGKTPSRRGAIIARGEDDNSYDLVWAIYLLRSGEFGIMIEDSVGVGTNWEYASGKYLADDKWHHVAATRTSAGTLVLYVDGTAAKTFTRTGVPSKDNAQDLTIGCSHGYRGRPPGGIEPPTWFFNGIIDEPAMWNRALSAAEVNNIYRNGVNALSSGLKGFWKLEEGKGQVVADLSSAKNHGFLGDKTRVDVNDATWVTRSMACYIGSEEDFAMTTLVDQGGDPGSWIKTVLAGEVLTVKWSSPSGGFTGAPAALLAGLHSNSPVFPKLHFDANFIFVVGPVVLPGAGTTWTVTMPTGLAGSNIMLQAVAITTTATNGLFASSDGHKIQIR